MDFEICREEAMTASNERAKSENDAATLRR
jgi:hypothetical protein